MELEPNTRSTRVPVQRRSPVLRSRPSNTSFASEVAFHSVRMSSRLAKKSLLNTPGRLVKTPFLESSTLAPSTRRPPTSTVNSGAVRVSSWALSINSASAGTA
ncbi:hypothetical protein XAUC_02150 [Xanthomonas citri pv. aurantifolii str. ICPB 10535]|nr:hypothetical protein XAUC_02150 [Xanthomonas citri pv. aurantifolii str. ICPB 10535]